MARGVVKKREGKSKERREEKRKITSNQRSRYFGRLKTPRPSELCRDFAPLANLEGRGVLLGVHTHTGRSRGGGKEELGTHYVIRLDPDPKWKVDITGRSLADGRRMRYSRSD